jgi:REP element-mobilizing transposase RayT
MEHYRRTSHTRFDIKLHFVWIASSGNVTDEVVREYIEKQDVLKPDDYFKVDHGQ